MVGLGLRAALRRQAGFGTFRATFAGASLRKRREQLLRSFLLAD